MEITFGTVKTVPYSYNKTIISQKIIFINFSEVA